MSLRHHDWLLLLLAFVCAALGILFVMLGAHVLGGATFELDQSLRNWTMSDRETWLIHAYEFISFIGDKAPLAILCAAIGWTLFPQKRVWIPLLACCALGVGLFVDWLKAAYEVMRPETGQLTSSSHSFPSGHTSGTAAIALFFAYVAIRNRVKPLLFAGGAVLLTLLVGVSRVYLDEHWASDVLGGWWVGTAFGAAFCALYEWILRHQRARAPMRVPSRDGVTVS